MFSRKKIAVVLFMTVLAPFLLTAAGPINPGAPTPKGFDKMLVYLANGVYDPDDPAFEMPTAEFFQREIMNRSDAEIAEDRAAAVAFYNQRFGLGLVDPGEGLFTSFETNGVLFTPFFFDPRNEYCAYIVSEEWAPATGWIVRDGGYSTSVVAEEGITLGGEFAGIHVPQGTSFAFGNYNIKRTLPSGKAIEPIIIHYQSGNPIIPNSDKNGGIFFRCELISDEFGHGLAQGVVAPQMMPDGIVHQNIRNVLTFPGLGE